MGPFVNEAGDIKQETGRFDLERGTFEVPVGQPNRHEHQERRDPRDGGVSGWWSELEALLGAVTLGLMGVEKSGGGAERGMQRGGQNAGADGRAERSGGRGGSYAGRQMEDGGADVSQRTEGL